MLRSMTGFGAASAEVDGTRIHVEARAVNHRHLLVKTRLASDDPSLEGEVDALVRKRLGRGSVSVRLGVEPTGDTRAAGVDAAVAASYRAELADLARSIDVPDEVSLETLIGLPGVVSAQRSDPADSPALRRAILATVDEALRGLVQMRSVEGDALSKDLAKHGAATAKLVTRVEKRMPQVVRNHQRQLEKRVGELLGDSAAVARTDLAREIAVLADRMDVSEEVSRLRSHLEQLDKLLGKGGQVGRKLDFLVQEVLREVNTVGSKCNDAKVAHWVVELKTHVERLREQVQNVE